MNRQRILYSALLVVLLGFSFALPYLGASSFIVTLATLVLVSATLAASMNFIMGDGGMASLGHASIAAGASYGVAWASQQGWSMISQVLLGLAVAIIISVICGILAMRMNGIYFMMVTLAVGMLVYGLAFRLSSVTGGENGISGVARPPWMQDYWVFYYVALVSFIVVTALFALISASPFGASLRGVRDSESRMRSLGYSVEAYKFSAFVISGVVAGFAGILFVWNSHFVSPASAELHRAIFLLMMVVLGGIGTRLGPLVGAAVVVLAENLLSNSVERWPTLLGLTFILVILFARAGVVGTISKLFRRWQKSPQSVTV